ncbi:MAG: glycosyltransferase family 2 protein [Sedimentisphaerales bacterium]|nr:glycosyltransferase family 2 protein [Sedimentisphaerales bacterium]
MSIDLLLLLIGVDIVTLVMAYCCFGLPALLYRKVYSALRLRQCDPNYAPTMSVFIPCKGADGGLAANVEAFLRHQGPKARLFFTVESEQDGAYPVIRQLIQDKPNVDLVVAGLAASCGQKNHNLLRAIERASGKDDVYVFLDSVTSITRAQLRDLVVPLSDPQITVCVGFRWDVLKDKTLGERLRAFMIALQWAVLNCPFITATWGGGTAIRRRDFEALGVSEYWGKTVVDDMALARLLHDQKRKAVFVPTCVKEMDSSVATVKGAILWFKRQALYLKFYLRAYWLCTIGLLLCCSINFVGFPILLVSSMIWPGRIMTPLAMVTGSFTLLMMVCCLATKRPAEDRHDRLSWFLFSPLYVVLACYAYLLGVWTRVLRWRGASYRLDRQGYVLEIVRH